MGRQAWVLLAIVSTEFLIVAKFDWETVTIPIPNHILLFWIIGLSMLVIWTVWRFFLSSRSSERRTGLDVDFRRKRWDLVRSCEICTSSSTTTTLLPNALADDQVESKKLD